VKPADALDHATSEIVSDSKLGIDATKKLPRRRLRTPMAAVRQDGCSGVKWNKLVVRRRTMNLANE
jgi:3-polyprenyl-4-hydroxybenzoate decarboxylase